MASEAVASVGDKAKEITYEEILKVRDQMDKMAEIFFNMWLEEIEKEIEN